MRREVEIWFLEMDSPAELRPSAARSAGFRLEQARIPSPELNHFLYTAVGGDWYWLDRMDWTWDQWMAWLDRPEVETWIGFFGGNPAGYFELERQPAGNVEIAYFGLLPGFTGRGIGGALLTAAIERAWAMGASRVTVNTCSLDAPAALENYRKRGFRLARTERVVKDLPEETPGPWPGARRLSSRSG